MTGLIYYKNNACVRIILVSIYDLPHITYLNEQDSTLLPLEDIQAYLQEHEIDGWLLADFHCRNDIAVAMLGLKGLVTRRSFYFIPSQGEPTALLHAIEADKFSGVSGEHILFSSYKRLEEQLRKILDGYNRIAMEYSPNGRLPYIGLVDAGTIELVRSFGCEIISSADLVANFQARLSPEQVAMHRIAAHNVIEVKEKAFGFIQESLADGKEITELDVINRIHALFEEYDMETEENPVCAVDANAGNPHYDPTTNPSPITMGQIILIDLWGKVKHDDGVYADITWMGYTGKRSEIPKRYVELFGYLAVARDRAVEFIRERIDSQPVHGSEVDDACREVIAKAGYGDAFKHRTGHSITSHIHGPGPNIDNLETEDQRRLQKGHLFSIEPGIYLDDCGFRSEIDALITPHGVEVTTLPLQTEILALFE